MLFDLRLTTLAVLAGLPALAQDQLPPLPDAGGLQPPALQAPTLQPPALQPPALQPGGLIPGFNPTPAPPPQPAPPATQPAQPDPNNPLQQILMQLDAYERTEMGVQPVTELHAGAMHGPTPATIPGGQLITTLELLPLIQSGQPYLLFDVLGDTQTLPGAIPMAPAAQPGAFNDQLQQQLGQYLTQVTGGNLDVPMVFYCASSQCWMSYNAALRAVNLGYRQVRWYRGGIEAWQYAQLPMQPAGQQPVPQQ